MNKIYVQLSSKNYEENDYKHDMDLLILYCTNCMFHIPQKVGYESSLHQNVKKSPTICAYNHMRSVGYGHGFIWPCNPKELIYHVITCQNQTTLLNIPKCKIDDGNAL